MTHPRCKIFNVIIIIIIGNEPLSACISLGNWNHSDQDARFNNDFFKLYQARTLLGNDAYECFCL